MRPCFLIFLAFAMLAPAQQETTKPTSKGKIEQIKVHGKALEGNLAGESPDREVSVYLPPGYSTSKSKRLPVIYMLHGGSPNSHGFPDDMLPLLEKAISSGTSKEMIVVMPNADTAYLGSFYGSSVTTGDWEHYLSRELVSYIDSNYRTLADRGSRGLAGLSMGGFGALRLGMKYPEVFSAIYAISPCCLDIGTNGPEPVRRFAPLESIRTVSEVRAANPEVRVLFAIAAAFSPAPDKPPLYIDLPTKNGVPQPRVLARWAANAPIAMLDQYVSNVRSLRAIAFDIGLQDNLLPGSRDLHERLEILGVPHTFETYEGTHASDIGNRIETKVLPFFSAQLTFGEPK